MSQDVHDSSSNIYRLMYVEYLNGVLMCLFFSLLIIMV